MISDCGGCLGLIRIKGVGLTKENLICLSVLRAKFE
nr:MAG TPA: hypothetical protein [Caudoviricetes sp.]